MSRDQIVNAKYYVDVLNELHRNCCKKAWFLDSQQLVVSPRQLSSTSSDHYWKIFFEKFNDHSLDPAIFTRFRFQWFPLVLENEGCPLWKVHISSSKRHEEGGAVMTILEEVFKNICFNSRMKKYVRAWGEYRKATYNLFNF